MGDCSGLDFTIDPYRQYTNFFIFRFVSLLCLRRKTTFTSLTSLSR